MSAQKETLKNRILLIHTVVFILVNAGMAAINLQFTPAVLWFIYPLIGWGIGLAIHALFSAGTGGPEQSARNKRATLRTKAFVAHLIIYLMVNILLLVVNLTYTPTFLWVAFPAAGWGIAVILHLLFGVVFSVKEA
ncbi:MAG: 2TM domain-containing protein [Dethiobacteria bacterium]